MGRFRSIALIIGLAAALAGVVWVAVPRAVPPSSTPSLADRMFALHFDLNNDEVLRFIPYGSSPMRLGQLRQGWRGATARDALEEGVLLFYAGHTDRFWGLSTGPGDVSQAIPYCGSVRKPEWEIADKLAQLPLRGDWVRRNEAPRDRRLQALQTILQNQLHRPITITGKSVPRPVLVVRGRYHFTSLGKGRRPADVQLFTDTLDPSEGAGGGSGDIRALLRRMEDITGRRIFDETERDAEHEAGQVAWSNNNSLWNVSRDEHLLGLLIQNVAQQTGLQMEKSTREVEVYFVQDQSPAPAGAATLP